MFRYCMLVIVVLLMTNAVHAEVITKRKRCVSPKMYIDDIMKRYPNTKVVVTFTDKFNLFKVRTLYNWTKPSSKTIGPIDRVDVFYKRGGNSVLMIIAHKGCGLVDFMMMVAPFSQVWPRINLNAISIHDTDDGKREQGAGK